MSGFFGLAVSQVWRAPHVTTPPQDRGRSPSHWFSVKDGTVVGKEFQKKPAKTAVLTRLEGLEPKPLVNRKATHIGWLSTRPEYGLSREFLVGLADEPSRIFNIVDDHQNT